ncbi:MAG: hypothetical protein A3B10_03925 [Candidatus Doudnabacteria bacterium RIFCSPLOWO2_01_FULL_44_21]|uniref:Uncharacterized protein n=1 Tax=Candidatus Doudnabacteria bacterium RIFCSPLOWO2_01_FULL_44_21 TaxID=1817841 RepID=A0A1F5PYA6_9BACT|nr:MAG: hypothetical protein A3B95_01920 [Candidatus Doudnabacteria bacterium RIFCSPHIGHO2_02_FULL_43_13b]OGE94905.1 MAG: hypothetical protein A3B10_03925 [Candidatus Doudnabacteria bacterium RIFCSPLOWO2_01_FULL_44_21]
MTKLVSFLRTQQQKILMVSVLVFAFALVATSALAALTFGALTQTSDGAFTLTAVDDTLLTLTSGSDAEDFTVSVTGATDSSLILASSGTEADALQITASAGGIDIAATGAAAQDIDVTNTGGSVNITATEAAADAIVLSASTAAGGIDITSNADVDITTTGAAGEDISLTNTGGSIILNATESAVDSIVIESTLGGIDILASGATAEDIDVINTGGSVNITATEAAANAIVLSASTAAGGIDITSNADIDISTTGEAGEDISITNTGGSVNIDATEDAALAITLTSNGGTSETIVVTNTLGTAVGAIALTSSAGGITLTSNLATADGINLVATGGGLDLDATLGATLDAVTFLSVDVTGATAASNISVAANADAEDLTIAVTGTDGDLILTTGDDFTLTGAAGSILLLGNATAGIRLFEETETITGVQALGINESGKTFYISTTGAAYTLPDVTTANGVNYRFVVSVAFGTDAVITAAEEGAIEGSLIVEGAVVDCDDEDNITFEDGVEDLGDFVEIRSDGVQWYIGSSNGAAAVSLTCNDPA